MNSYKAFPKPVAILFCLLGLSSVISFRIIIIVQRFQADYVRLFWYWAVIANMIFFLFRYYISLKRKRAVRDQSLIAKLQDGTPLDQTDKNAILYLLTSIERSQENLNYLSIFAFSIIAMGLDIFLSMQ